MAADFSHIGTDFSDLWIQSKITSEKELENNIAILKNEIIEKL